MALRKNDTKNREAFHIFFDIFIVFMFNICSIVYTD